MTRGRMVSDSSADADVSPVNGWFRLRRQLVKRSITPWRHVRFTTNFLVGVATFGGIGFWVELGRYFNAPTESGQEAMLTALLTLIPALVGATALQLVFEKEDDRPLQAFGIFFGFFICLAAGVAILCKMTPGMASFLLAGAGCLLALWFWAIANANNGALHDQINPDATVGGKPTDPLQGTTEGFNVG